MVQTPSIDPLKNFSVAPLTAGKMSDAYSKALAGAVTTPDENQRLMRNAEKASLPGMKVPTNGLANAVKAIKVEGQVKAQRGM